MSRRHKERPSPSLHATFASTLQTRALEMLRTQRCMIAVAVMCGVLSNGAAAQVASAPTSTTELPLFAVEIKVGPKWDSAKPPQDQALFKEHSANLRRLREAGALVMGARYSDKGLVIIAAATAADVKAQMDQDPSIAAGTFVYEVHPFNVFYAGEVKARTRR